MNQMPKQRGTVRTSLLKLGREMLERDGPDSLSVRKLAAAAGVSHNAPYMHFDGREGLIAALAAAGFEDLGAAISAAGEQAGDAWPNRFRAGCSAYVTFAIANPVLYATMHRGFDPAVWTETHEASITAFGLLKRALAEGQDLGEIRPGHVHTIALAVWASLHGLAGILGRSEGSKHISAAPAEQIIRDTLDLILSGIAAPK